VVGFDVSGPPLHAAHRSRALDRAVGDLRDAVEGADLVVIATPVRAVEDVLREIGNLLPEGAVVTDTASTKAQVVEWAERLLPHRVGFVGGHPMTGKTTANVDGPDAGLFLGTTYCLTPTANTPPPAVERAVWLAESVGGVPYFVEPHEHDALVALVSHLPYLLAATLMEDLGGDGAWREMSAIASGGLLTATALAEGDPRMFADICLTNRPHLVATLDRYIGQLQRLRDQIGAGDSGLQTRFEGAQRLRLQWLESRVRPPSDVPMDALRPSNPFFPSRWTEMLKGKRPEPREPHEDR
jgi:prephenate dehydrogenase